jgi:hypothetical protein
VCCMCGVAGADVELTGIKFMNSYTYTHTYIHIHRERERGREREREREREMQIFYTCC